MSGKHRRKPRPSTSSRTCRSRRCWTCRSSCMAFFIFTFRPAPTEGQIAMALPKEEGGAVGRRPRASPTTSRSRSSSRWTPPQRRDRQHDDPREGRRRPERRTPSGPTSRSTRTETSTKEADEEQGSRCKGQPPKLPSRSATGCSTTTSSTSSTMRPSGRVHRHRPGPDRPEEAVRQPRGLPSRSEGAASGRSRPGGPRPHETLPTAELPPDSPVQCGGGSLHVRPVRVHPIAAAAIRDRPRGRVARRVRGGRGRTGRRTAGRRRRAVDDRPPLPPTEPKRPTPAAEVPHPEPGPGDLRRHHGQVRRRATGGIEDDKPLASEKQNPDEYNAWTEVVLHARQFPAAELEQARRPRPHPRDLTQPTRAVSSGST